MRCEGRKTEETGCDLDGKRRFYMWRKGIDERDYPV